MAETIKDIARKEPARSGAAGFNACRAGFNSAYLAEDFSAAAANCESALAMPELKKFERVELSRFFLLLGRVDEALGQLGLLLEQDPSDHCSALQIARIMRVHSERSDYAAFMRGRIADYPKHEPYYHDYLEYLKGEPKGDELQWLRQTANENGIELRGLECGGVPSETMAIAGPEKGTYSESDLITMLELFRGRENCHARQWVADSGKHGYTPVREPLSINTLRNHLLGLQTIGVYQLDLNNRVGWIVFDLDLNSAHLDDLHDPDFRLWLDKGYQQVISDFRSVLGSFHIGMNVEFSGYKGYHIWLFFQERISARIARAFAQRIAAQVNLGGFPLSLEVFPKQTRANPTSFGNLVKLPYGVHRLSGVAGSMIDEEGKIISFGDFIRKPKVISSAEFLSALHSLDPGFSIGGRAVDKPEPQPDDDKTIEIPFDPNADPEWLCLKDNCQALRMIEDTARSTGKLDASQKNILRHVCGHLKNGPAIVNSIFGNLSNCEPQDLMNRPLKGNSMSCQRIQQLLGNLGGPDLCDCEFGETAGMYPTPLLHLKKLNPEIPAPLQAHEYKLKDTICGYIQLKKQFQEIGALLEERERAVIRIFEEIGTDEIASPYGILEKSTRGTQVSLVLKLK